MSAVPLTSKERSDTERQINFWRHRIESATKLPMYEEFKKIKEQARAYYRGDQLPKAETSAWEGDTVQANLFRRHINFMLDAVYAQTPTKHVRPRAKFAQTPMAEQGADAVETHINYLFEEESIDDEIKRSWKEAYLSNVAAMKITFDAKRGLWRAKWIAGELLVDPDAHGDLSRARWVAEKVQLPRYRVWQDETFDPKARDEIHARQGSENIEYSQHDGSGPANKDIETLWYIWSKEGLDPITGVDPQPNRLFVIAENCEFLLLNEENPNPYLDDDEFPIEVIRLDEIPGEWYGIAPYKVLESICTAFNWAASYHMADMRKTATSPIGYDKNKIQDVEQLKSRKHKMLIACEGDPQSAVFPFNIGQADKTIFDSVNFFRNLADQITGIDELARGEEGRTKTATESQILQTNSNINLRGPSQALDKFTRGIVRKLVLATLYYTPAFSVFEGPPAMQPTFDPTTLQMVMTQVPQFFTRMPVQVPSVDPMSGLPAMDMMIGQPVMQTMLQTVPVQADRPMKGIDYFHGDQVAMAWPIQAQGAQFEEIKCDLHFKIEAGSSRFERRMERKAAAVELFNTLGAVFVQFGLWEQYYEVLKEIINSFELEEHSKFLPPKEIFVQQVQMMAMAAQQQQQQQGEGDKEKFEGTKNPGKAFPMTAGNQDNRSSGSD